MRDRVAQDAGQDDGTLDEILSAGGLNGAVEEPSLDEPDIIPGFNGISARQRVSFDEARDAVVKLSKEMTRSSQFPKTPIQDPIVLAATKYAESRSRYNAAVKSLDDAKTELTAAEEARNLAKHLLDELLKESADSQAA